MPQLFEVFGYRVGDSSAAAKDARRRAWCPFANRRCDGGGNRHQSSITVKPGDPLSKVFGGTGTLAAGVCSIQTDPKGSPWVVCPRRLLALDVTSDTGSHFQDASLKSLATHAGLPKGTKVAVFPEVKLKVEKKGPKGFTKSFDYTLDYVLVPKPPASAKAQSDWWKGYGSAGKAGPAPIIVEIMTSSTSGGNKTKRTTISAAFEDAMLGKPHQAPGINYRQVWARMVSQLAVKSEIGRAWGGITFWYIQDVLRDYISATTALNIEDYRASKTSEVNVVSLGYDDLANLSSSGVLELAHANLYSGTIGRATVVGEPGGFQDMIRAPFIPELTALYRLLEGQKPTGILSF